MKHNVLLEQRDSRVEVTDPGPHDGFVSRQLVFGIDARVGPGANQGLHAIYFNRVEGDRLVPLRDWSALRIDVETL